MATKTKNGKLPRMLDPETLNEINSMVASRAGEETLAKMKRETAALWWSTVAVPMARLHSDVHKLRLEVDEEGSPLKGFIPEDRLADLASAIERADSAASSIRR